MYNCCVIDYFRHGFIEKRAESLSENDLLEVYSQVGLISNRKQKKRQGPPLNFNPQTPRANFSHYTYPYFKEHNATVTAPIVWFVSHCSAHSGRWGHFIMLFPHHHTFLLPGINTLGGCRSGSVWTYSASAGTSSAARWRTSGTSTPPMRTPASTWSTGSTGQ